MASIGELVYIVLDELKNSSDDQFVNFDHVKFLLSKYRAFLLKQRYADIKKPIPNSNYQTVCVDLELDDLNPGVCGGEYVRSVQEVPYAMQISSPKISPMDFFGTEITYVSWSRFRYVGYNKYLKNFIYGTIGPDNHLYLSSSNPQYQYLNKAKITAVFEDVDAASELSCDDNSDGNCDSDNTIFPLEEGLIPQMIQLIVQELTGTVYRPKDEVNNSADDLSGIPTK